MFSEDRKRRFHDSCEDDRYEGGPPQFKRRASLGYSHDSRPHERHASEYQGHSSSHRNEYTTHNRDRRISKGRGASGTPGRYNRSRSPSPGPPPHMQRRWSDHGNYGHADDRGDFRRGSRGPSGQGQSYRSVTTPRPMPSQGLGQREGRYVTPSHTTPATSHPPDIDPSLRRIANIECALLDCAFSRALLRIGMSPREGGYKRQASATDKSVVTPQTPGVVDVNESARDMARRVPPVTPSEGLGTPASSTPLITPTPGRRGNRPSRFSSGPPVPPSNATPVPTPPTVYRPPSGDDVVMEDVGNPERPLGASAPGIVVGANATMLRTTSNSFGHSNVSNNSPSLHRVQPDSAPRKLSTPLSTHREANAVPPGVHGNYRPHTSGRGPSPQVHSGQRGYSHGSRESRGDGWGPGWNQQQPPGGGRGGAGYYNRGGGRGGRNFRGGGGMGRGPPPQGRY